MKLEYYILGLNEEHQKALKKYERNNLKIEFIDLNEKIERIANKLYTRDYFSMTTYYRLFLPDLYPELKKAVYIDADTVLLADIAELYKTDLGTNLVGAVPDGAVQSVKEFQDYVELVVGLKDYNNYFNAGILVMNLEELRNYRFQVKFTPISSINKDLRSFLFGSDLIFLYTIRRIIRIWKVLVSFS